MSGDGKHEIVIVRHRHSDHDDHHGGAWKIAFADFMTAMMAFFLVMWLISANDKTRASVARYFNPVRLVDATTQPRGLHDSKKDESGITASADTKEEGAGTKGKKPGSETKIEGKAAAGGAETPASKDKRLDAALRENPYAALAEIVATKGPGEAPATEGGRAQAPPAMGRRGGDAFRDPFAPAVVALGEADSAGDPDRVKAQPKSDGPGALAPVGQQEKAAAVPGDAAKLLDAAKAGDQAKTADKAAKAGKVDADVSAELAVAAKAAGREAPKIDVRRTSEGLIVSLTDTADFSMFPNGSAVPAKRVVMLMEKIAAALKVQPGMVVVRGYTDNKPFKSGRYDNWHLSLDRAQVTHYMLVRGGFADDRIGHVEGYADRGARHGVDPASPLNRRIEILLKDAAP